MGSKSHPRILFISPEWPNGGTFGGQIRATETGTALREIGPVSLLVINSTVPLRPTGDGLSGFHVFPAVRPELTARRNALAKLRWAFDLHYLDLHGTTASKADQERVEDLRSKFDLVWVFNSRLPNILQQWSWPGTHLDIDDVPSTYFAAVAGSGGTWRTRWKARLQQRLVKRRESILKDRFTTLSVCSEDDRDYLGGGEQIHVIPNGFTRSKQAPVRCPSSESPRIGFIGLYDYEPNREGVVWFLNACWPAIQAAVPGVRFRLVGKGTNGPVVPGGQNVDKLGFVEDAAAEIATWSAMMIPIRLGGGTRIKIADAFCRKCPVVSTSLGAYGYGVQDGKQLRLADTPEQFAAACIDVIRNRAEADAMAERAYQEFLEKWTWDAIAPRVWAAAEDCLRRSRDQGRGSRARS